MGAEEELKILSKYLTREEMDLVLKARTLKEFEKIEIRLSERMGDGKKRLRIVKSSTEESFIDLD
jgi:hypothetical protein